MSRVFTPDSEAAVVYLACARPNFWSAAGAELVPEMLADKVAQLTLNAAKALALEFGAPPSAHAVVQRLNRWREQGQHKVTHEHVVGAAKLLANGEDAADLIGEDFLLSECVAVVRKHLQKLHAQYAIERVSKDDDEHAEKIDNVLDRLRVLGISKAAQGGFLDTDDPDAADASVAARKGIPRIDLGIHDLDVRLEGVGAGQLVTVVGVTGAGKSLFLAQSAGAALLQGKCVAFVSLEIDKESAYTRIVAGMTGHPTREFAQYGGPLAYTQALGASRTERFASGLPFGRMVVEQFTAQSTTVSDLKKWAARLPFTPHVVVVDYGDLLSSESKKSDSSYLAMRDVWEALRLWAASEKIWIYTAAQMKARDSKGKKTRADTDAAADSMHKGRITDVMLTLNMNEDFSEVDIFVAKNRHGASRFPTGPLPTHFEYGRLVAQLTP